MKLKLATALVAGALAAMAATGANAALVTGTLQFNGPDVDVLTGPGGTAVTDFNNGRYLHFSSGFLTPELTSYSGTGAIGAAFPRILGGASGTGTIQDIYYRPISGTFSPINNFFVIGDIIGGDVLSFDLRTVQSSVTNGLGNQQFLTLSGMGTLHLTGYEATAGTWSLTTQHSNGVASRSLTWSADTGAVVPVPGALALLGAGFVGMGGTSLLRKRKAQA